MVNVKQKYKRKKQTIKKYDNWKKELLYSVKLYKKKQHLSIKKLRTIWPDFPQSSLYSIGWADEPNARKHHPAAFMA